MERAVEAVEGNADDDAENDPPREAKLTVSHMPFDVSFADVDGGGVRVADVMRGGAAQAAGVEVGMRLLALNGRDTSAMSKSEVLKLFGSPNLLDVRDREKTLREKTFHFAHDAKDKTTSPMRRGILNALAEDVRAQLAVPAAEVQEAAVQAAQGALPSDVVHGASAVRAGRARIR